MQAPTNDAPSLTIKGFKNYHGLDTIITPSQKHVVLQTESDGPLQLISLETGENLFTFGDQVVKNDYFLLDDGDTLVTSRQAWSVSRRELLREHSGPKASRWPVLDPGGIRHLIMHKPDCTMDVWDAREWKSILPLQAPWSLDDPLNARWTPDGAFLVALGGGGGGGPVYVWHGRTGELVEELYRDKRADVLEIRVNAMCMSPDGRYLYLGGDKDDDYTPIIVVHDLWTGEKSETAVAPTGVIREVFINEGNTAQLVSFLYNREDGDSIHVWDRETIKCALELDREKSNGISFHAFSTKKHLLATSHNPGAFIRFWDTGNWILKYEFKWDLKYEFRWDDYARYIKFLEKIDRILVTTRGGLSLWKYPKALKG